MGHNDLLLLWVKKRIDDQLNGKQAQFFHTQSAMKHTILLLILLVSFTGCKTITDLFRTKEEILSIRFLDSNALRISQKYFPEGESTLETLIIDYDSLVLENKLNEANNLRNGVVHDLITLSDYIYNIQKDYYFNLRAKSDTYFDITDLALTGTAAAFGSASTKAALSAAATFLTGTRQSLDSNFYAEQSIATIISKMDGNRAKAELIIENSMKNTGSGVTNQFSLREAIKLVQRYHRAGSIIEAVIDLNRSAASDADNAQKALEQEVLGEETFNKVYPSK